MALASILAASIAALLTICSRSDGLEVMMRGNPGHDTILFLQYISTISRTDWRVHCDVVNPKLFELQAAKKILAEAVREGFWFNYAEAKCRFSNCELAHVMDG
ncbi:MAG: hypothetical protein LUQ38_03565 [Methanotrichaceae archaeon]|nr:hypothetical protein [Methanotrichaceae archaeon]